jgi:DNA-binding MarR family transcriptional regulator
MHTEAGVADELSEELMRFVRLLKSATQSELGADRSQLLLLWPLMHDGPMRLRDLAEAKGSDASTVSRQAAQLVKAGLLRRDPDPLDRRACLLALTEGGRDVCRRLTDARRRAIAEALREWSPERVRAFTEMFREFNRAVEAHQPLLPGIPDATPPAGADDTTALATTL